MYTDLPSHTILNGVVRTYKVVADVVTDSGRTGGDVLNLQEFLRIIFTGVRKRDHKHPFYDILAKDDYSNWHKALEKNNKRIVRANMQCI